MNSRNRGQELATASDGLPALSVAQHAKDKEYALSNVTGIFTQAMKRTWPGKLYYVDPFSGPGKCVIRDSDQETEGSPIIAAMVPFTYYFFADEDQRCIDALKERIGRLHLSEKQFHYYNGEADDTIDRILKDLPPENSSLGLALLDSWAWDFSFKNLMKLTRNRRLDILINFNIGDTKRRWSKPSPRLDSFLNLATDHRDFFTTGVRGVPDTRSLLDHYEEELKKIGYNHIADDRPVKNSNNTPLYHIIFGSKHPLGKRLRDAVSLKTASGQFVMPL